MWLISQKISKRTGIEATSFCQLINVLQLKHARRNLSDRKWDKLYNKITHQISSQMFKRKRKFNMPQAEKDSPKMITIPDSKSLTF